jgi:hypothetical protein
LPWIGNRAAQSGAWWAEIFFTAVAVCSPARRQRPCPSASGTERVSLVALLAVGLFLCKFVHDPAQFGAYDEFLHWRTAQDIAVTGQVFTPNTLLGVSPYYPGLELATTALSNVAGIPIFMSGIIVLVAARLVFLVSLFFFFAMISGNTRVAALPAWST